MEINAKYTLGYTIAGLTDEINDFWKTSQLHFFLNKSRYHVYFYKTQKKLFR